MPELPSHPRTERDASVSADPRPPRGKRRWVSFVWVALVVVAVLAMVVLHLAGVVGPGSH